MLMGFIMWYLFGKTILIIYTTLCFLVSVYYYNSSMKFYFPAMENKETQHFHDKYPEFSRKDLPSITLGRLFFFTFSFVIPKILSAVAFTTLINFLLRLNK